MVLIDAKKEAIEASRKNDGKTIYINVDEKDGECSLCPFPDHTTHAAYKNGSEIALPVSVSEQQKVQTPPAPKVNKKTATKTIAPAKPVIVKVDKTQKKSPSTKVSKQIKSKNKMGTATKKAGKKKPAKKAAKKTAAKKATGKPVGKLVTKTVKETLALVKKGNRAYNHAGKPLPEGYLSKMGDQSRELQVTIVAAE